MPERNLARDVQDLPNREVLYVTLRITLRSGLARGLPSREVLFVTLEEHLLRENDTLFTRESDRPNHGLEKADLILP